jgi:branched-chain amino acid transport system substrate-binding protein
MAAGLLAACGSSSHSSSSNTTTNSSSSAAGSAGSSATTGSAGSTGSAASTGSTGAAPTGAPIKFGVIVSQSGPDSSSLAIGANVYKAWASWTNANGGINGHPVQVTVLDDQGSPSVALSDAHTLIEGDHVLSLSGLDIGGGQNVGPYAASKNIPMVGGIYMDSWGTGISHPNVYMVSAHVFAEWAADMQVIKQLGGSKFGFVTYAQTGTTGEISAFQYLAQQGGLPYKKTVTVSFTQPDYTAQCLALKQAGVDAINTSIPDQPLKTLLDQCAVQGYHPIMVGQEAQLSGIWLSDPNFAKSGGTIPTFPWFDTSVPAIQNYINVMKQYDPAALNGATGSQEAATEAWASMVVLGAAAKAGNVGPTSTPADLVRGLQTINGDTFGGLTPPLNYANGGNLNVPVCPYVVKVSNGQWQVLNNGQRLCIPSSEVSEAFHINVTGHK